MNCPDCSNPVHMVDRKVGLFECRPCRRRWFSIQLPVDIEAAVLDYIANATLPGDAVSADIPCGLCGGEGCVTCNGIGRA